MRITELHIENFRSIRELHLTGLGPFVVLYGENGAGKTAVMDAIASLRAMATIGRSWKSDGAALAVVVTDPNSESVDVSGFIRPEHVHWSANGAPVNLAACVSDFDRTGVVARVSVTVRMVDRRAQATVAWSIEGEPPDSDRVRSWARTDFYFGLFSILAQRPPSTREGSEWAETVEDALFQGSIAQAVALAQASPLPKISERLIRLRKLLAAPPLNRPGFVPVRDLTTRLYGIREEVRSDPAGRSLEHAGLGAEQLYGVLAQIVLSGCSIATIEEPEAHLHAPTTGRALRDVLKRMVDTAELDQLWIATHSNLFDLDPDGYYDVRLDPELGTVVERRPLSDIDARHLYEPGPAKHALQAVLSYVPADTVFFRRPDGTPVTAPELLEMLQRDDPLAVEFLRAVHGAAVRSVQVQSKFGKTPK